MKKFEVIHCNAAGVERAIHRNLTERQAIEYTDYIDNTYYREQCPLCEQIKRIDPEKVISLKNKYGSIFWSGKAKFVFNAVTAKAWESDEIGVII